jgi:hypothetical protein
LISRPGPGRGGAARVLGCHVPLAAAVGADATGGPAPCGGRRSRRGPRRRRRCGLYGIHSMFGSIMPVIRQ